MWLISRPDVHKRDTSQAQAKLLVLWCKCCCGLPTEPSPTTSCSLPEPFPTATFVLMIVYTKTRVVDILLVLLQADRLILLPLSWKAPPFCQPVTLLSVLWWKWRKLVVKSSVVSQRPLRLRDRWRWRKKEGIVTGCKSTMHQTELMLFFSHMCVACGCTTAKQWCAVWRCAGTQVRTIPQTPVTWLFFILILMHTISAVSYTHLTLPTKLSV